MSTDVKQLRVMTAEDDEDIRTLVRAQLEMAGNQIFEAATGPAVLTVLDENDVDVIILDVDLPNMNGLDVLARLKANPKTADIPVVMLTAKAGSADVIKALDIGAHDYVTKPFSRGELVARVHSAGRVKMMQDKLRDSNKRLEYLSETDVLTGLHNRRYAEGQLEASVANARRYGTPMSALIIDVDHFKSINDDYGHVSGDRALTQVAECLVQSLRTGDIAARWGGEEFLVVMPMTDLSGAERVAERIRRDIAGTPVNVGDHEVVLTVSIGCAEGKDAAALLKQADDALYRAKDAGRNTVSR